MSITRQKIIGRIEKRIAQETADDPKLREILKIMQGKTLGLQIVRPAYTLYFHADGEVLTISEQDGHGVDTWIKGSLLNLCKMAVGKKSTGIQAEISGDVALGKTFQRFIARLDLSWEDFAEEYFDLSTLNLVGSVLQSTSEKYRSISAQFADAAGDYLSREKKYTPTAAKIEEFNAGVDDLRSRLDRLDSSISQLETGKDCAN